MDLTITKILIESSNVVLKNAANEIVKIIPAQFAFANPDEKKDGWIILNTKASFRDLHSENLPIKISDIIIPAPPFGGWTVDLLLQELKTNFINVGQPVKITNTPLTPIYVNVVNQIDLTAIVNSLNQIASSCQDIDANTDDVEDTLDDIITVITNTGSINHADLLLLLTQLQAVNANTDTLESIASNILTAITTTTADYVDFGIANNIPASLNSIVEFTITYGHSSIGFHLTPPTGGTVRFEGTFDGTNWTPITIREIGNNGYTQISSIVEDYIGSISCLKKFRIVVIAAGSAAGTIIGKMTKQVSTLEGIEHSSAPHLFGYPIVHKDSDFAGTNTGATIWIPTTNKKFVVTELLISTGVIVGTQSITIFDHTNATGKVLAKVRSVGNGFYAMTLKTPFVSSSQNNILKYTNTGVVDCSVVVHGYEID